ncbi:uncharacterized protein N7484_004084 [Penicillium longicatenatum]|uniref:uncharacterized protein n=1 Tax=Penicillium longicatenatum TaxID=1561947 RepID=UPI002548D272|nr:uncharacterized protein N7484_004084 [Penicillium longicatenatum]KAJ5650361.1 hypothetical protein N7484_004084 [Penicillium longicatenatum]
MASIFQREAQARECKAPRRSRFGCRNCKLRKLKCDESKPNCKRCSSFGVLCNFASNIPDLQPVAADSGRPLTVRRRAQLLPPVCSAVWTSDEITSYQLNAKCQDFITRYLGRSLTTPDDPSMKYVNRKLLRLAFTHPFLMHASLAVALTYDRHLHNSLGNRHSLEECYHWSQSTALLNRRLRKPIKAEDKDAIWGTAAALAILSVSSPEAYTPEESWPLNPSDNSNLDWIHMSKSKMALWDIVNPLRPDSLFCVMAATFARMEAPLLGKGTDGVPSALAGICLLEDSSTATNNPYFHAAHAVSQVMGLPDNEVTTGESQIFIRTIHGRFEDLLRGRDPVALLLLYLWYRKVGRSIWWIELRARVECPSICLYLQRHHKANVAVQAFLPGGSLAEMGN